MSGSPPDVVPPDPVDPAAGTVPRWGLGDVLAGIALANLLLVVSQVVAYSIGGWTEMAQVPLWAVALLQIPMWVGWIIVVVWAARTKGNGVVADFGLRARWPDLPVGVALGLVVQLAVLPAIYWPILRLIGQTNEDLARPAQALADKAQEEITWQHDILQREIRHAIKTVANDPSNDYRRVEWVAQCLWTFRRCES